MGKVFERQAEGNDLHAFQHRLSLPFLAAIYTFFAMPQNRGAPAVLIGNAK